MKNKVLVNVLVPELEKSYDIYLPIHLTIGKAIELLGKTITELNEGAYQTGVKTYLYDSLGQKYPLDVSVQKTEIRNGTKVILL